MNLNLDIEPLKTFCGIELSAITKSLITEKFGEPSEIELSNHPLTSEDIQIYHYDELGFSVYFLENELLNICVNNKDARIFKENIFRLRENEIIDLFKLNGFEEFELDKDWGEKQLVFEKAGITVFFDNQKVSEIFVDV